MNLSGLEDTYGGRSVLVTGHTGFKGSWLCAWLSRLGAQVSGISLAPDESQQELFAITSSIVDFKQTTFGDVRDLSQVDGIFEKTSPEIVFHLAAQPLVRKSYREPIETLSSNIMGTAHVLDAVRRYSTPVVVCVTSDKAYENVEQMWPYRETDRMGGSDPYSASKGAAELVIESYRRSFFPPGGDVACASARAGNVIGGGDLSEDRLVPDFYRALASGSEIVLRRPNATRPWQHILESLSGYLTLGSALHNEGTNFAGAWNFGPDPSERYTVGDFISALQDSYGAGAPSVTIENTGPHEASRLALDVTKAAEKLNWRPFMDLGTRIDLTIDWFKASQAEILSSTVLSDQITEVESIWFSA
jgi:CDP-glucose 4,6-dehydratase